MSGPIVRTGPTPKFSANWDKIFAKGKKAAAKPAAAAPAKKAAKKKAGKKKK